MTPWHLTPQAQSSLIDIALWTLDRFGPEQAVLYESEILKRCEAIASGRAPSQDCSVLLDAALDPPLRFTRAGEHFLVFQELPDEIVIVDILHSRTDLPARTRAPRHLRNP